MTRKDIVNLMKRFFLTFLACIPIFVGLHFLLTNKIADWLVIIIFMTVAGSIFALEEYIRFKNKAKREEKKRKIKEELFNKKKEK